MTDFMWRQVPIEETQVCLRQLVQTADEEGIRDIFAKFLTAPTESPDQKTKATNTLCEIFDIECLIETNKRKPYEVWCASNDIMREAEVRRRHFLSPHLTNLPDERYCRGRAADNCKIQICFGGNEEKTGFLAERIPSGAELGEKSMAMREQVKIFAASEPKLSELVSKYYELCDMSEEEMEASRH